MASKPPESQNVPTLPRLPPRSQAAFKGKHDSCALRLEGIIFELTIAYQTGENPNSAARFLALISSIPPERLDSCVPGMDYPVRRLLEHIAIESIHDSVRGAAARLLESAIPAPPSSTAIPLIPSGKDMACEAQPPNPGFSRPPLRIQALEVLRGHIEGYAPDYTETDLNNAIDALKFDNDSEVAIVLANAACSSPYESVKEKAREVLLKF